MKHFQLTEYQFMQILLHEMVHIYDFNCGHFHDAIHYGINRYNAHGEWFQEECIRLEEETGFEDIIGPGVIRIKPKQIKNQYASWQCPIYSQSKKNYEKTIEQLGVQTYIFVFYDSNKKFLVADSQTLYNDYEIKTYLMSMLIFMADANVRWINVFTFDNNQRQKEFSYIEINDYIKNIEAVTDYFDPRIENNRYGLIFYDYFRINDSFLSDLNKIYKNENDHESRMKMHAAGADMKWLSSHYVTIPGIHRELPPLNRRRDISRNDRIRNLNQLPLLGIIQFKNSDTVWMFGTTSSLYKKSSRRWFNYLNTVFVNNTVEKIEYYELLRDTTNIVDYTGGNYFKKSIYNILELQEDHIIPEKPFRTVYPNEYLTETVQNIENNTEQTNVQLCAQALEKCFSEDNNDFIKFDILNDKTFIFAIT